MATRGEELAAVLRIFKGHLTRQINSSQKLCKFAADNNIQTTQMANQLDEQLLKLNTQYNKLRECLLELSELDPAHGDDWAAALDLAEQRHFDEQANLLRALQEVQAPPLAPVGALPVPQVAPNTLKPITALKPEPISTESNPTELEDFLDKFKAFYNASNLQQTTIDTQQSFLRNCLAPDLATVIKTKIQRGVTPIFDNDPNVETVFSVLQKEWQARYPLCKRRFLFFSLRQGRSEAFSAFYAKLKELGNTCKLNEMGIEEIYVFRLLCAVYDEHLKEKMMELEELTLERIETLGRANESARITINTLKTEKPSERSVSDHSTNRTRHQNRGQRQNQGRGQNDQDDFKIRLEAKMSELKAKQMCIHCGKHRYDKDKPCKFKTQDCLNCGRRGHISTICTDKQAPKPMNNVSS